MYGYIGSMRTRPGKRDEVLALLLEGLGALPAAGCLSYVAGACREDEDRIWVSEVWESAEHHAASLQLPEVRTAVAAAMPLLSGEFTRRETQVAGGLGLAVAPGGRP